MRRSISIRGVVAIFLGLANVAMAVEDLNGYVAPFAMGQLNTGKTDNVGGRGGAGIEFARIYRWIALDLRYLSGQNYTDTGGSLKFYDHWLSENGSHIFTFGGGAGLSVAPKGDDSVVNRQFTDIFVTSGLTYIWDSHKNWGVLVRIGCDLVLGRRYLGGKDDPDDNIPVNNGTPRLRPFLTVGIPLGA